MSGSGTVSERNRSSDIGTDAYKEHKRNHFPKADNQNIATNEALLLSDAKTRATYEAAYARGSALYYKGRPTLEEILNEIKSSIESL